MNWFGRRFDSFRCAFIGLGELISTQPNALIHLAATFFAIALGAYLRVGQWEWLAIAIAIGFVWVCEGFNTAIETLTDGFCADRNETARRVKDVSAAAVLLSAFTAAAIGALVFLPRLATW